MAPYGDPKLKVFSGLAHPKLAQQICRHIGLIPADLEITQFSDGETRVVVNENVRGCDVFVVQSTIRPNETMLELLILIDAMRRASASRITAVIPYYGYARQDRKTRGREPITAKLVANLITVAGVDRVLTVDLHAGQIQGFFDLPVDHLTAVPLLGRYIREKHLGDDVVVVSPDAGGGGVPRAREMADRLGVPLAIIDKRRPEPNRSEVANVVGDVVGKVAVLVDDIIDTAGTLCKAAEALRDNGASAVYACGVHPLMSHPAVTRLAEAPICEVVVTDTIPLSKEMEELSKIRVVSIAPLLGDAIVRIHEDRSVSRLFT